MIVFSSTEEAISNKVMSLKELKEQREYYLEMTNKKENGKYIFSKDDRIYFATQAQFMRECMEARNGIAKS